MPDAVRYGVSKCRDVTGLGIRVRGSCERVLGNPRILWGSNVYFVEVIVRCHRCALATSLALASHWQSVALCWGLCVGGGLALSRFGPHGLRVVYRWEGGNGGHCPWERIESLHEQLAAPPTDLVLVHACDMLVRRPGVPVHFRLCAKGTAIPVSLTRL